MSLDVDEILNKLSTKFNKIFYDREFVCCVNQDLQVVLKNKNSCCVVVFPVLGPNYLKAVRYQAKIFDLAVITLGTGRNRAIAVCQKEFLKKNSNEVTETTKVQIMPQSSTESSIKLRKKRPERQLYVPPAQRRLPLNTEEIPCNSEKFHNVKNEDVINTKKETCSKTVHKSGSKEFEKSYSKLRNKQCSADAKYKRESTRELPELLNNERCRVIESEKRICFDYLFSINYICILWHYQVAKSDLFSGQNFFKSTLNFCEQLPLYNRPSRLNILYILHNNYVLWQPKLNICSKCDTVSSDSSRTYPLYNFKELPLMPCECELQKKMPVLGYYRDDKLKTIYKNVLRNFDDLEHAVFRISWDENRCVSESDVVVDLSVINCGHNFIISSENGSNYFYQCGEVHDIWKCYLDKKKDVYNRIVSSFKDESNLPVDQKLTPLINNTVIVLEDKTLAERTEDTSILTVKKNNNKNTSTNTNVTRNDLINNMTNELIKTPKKSSEHEQEKEIMRKTKEHINRKSRPIMKYVDDTVDMLKIDKNDNVNNWEELFDDDGQLQDDLFKEVVHKVGSDFTILRAKEDYSEYVTKQSEDLEHMVELYDFPPTLETHDIIQAFSVINSEAMYVKWVDDTHAILVLGSLKQAQRAIELDNPLIKVRPMTVASGVSLEMAYKHDLKPAMKRPQTNLQTARRLITTHLGTKSRISKEQNAKERNDLKMAKELKKLAKKNEQDAWEGNLRSAIH
ncbi:uncharacterized protein LOC108917013 [Anoplophora glabripennis]|nr:uncharacterized protein LOC108917013 [Anoplophora glabripennis]